MNQNGFVPRNNLPGYSYGQPNNFPQNGYPGTGAMPQGGAQNPAGFSAQNSSPVSGYSASLNGTGYGAAPQASGAGGYGTVQQSPATGGYSPVPQVSATGGYSPAPQVSATGGYSPVPPVPATGGYSPAPPAPATGGYSPAPSAPATGGYSPAPPVSATGGYNPVPSAPATGGYSPVPPMPVNSGYNPVPPAAANNAYTAYRPQSAPAGSFIPKTPYSPGYTGPGYQQGYQKPAANGYPQGFSAYTQMGRIAPQNTSPQQKPAQVPLNGGGYVPQQVKVRRRPPEKADIFLYAASGVLLLLFALGMFVPIEGFQWLKWLFIVPAAATIALLWVKRITEDNKRLCFTVVAGVLCIVMIISLISAGNQDPTKKKNNGGNGGSGQQSEQTSDGYGNPDLSGTTVINPSGKGSVQQAGTGSGWGDTNIQNDTGNGQQGEAVANAAARERLKQVFICWSTNDLDQMVELCLPSWRVKQENAKKELFTLLQNRTPIGDVDLVNDPGQNGDSLSFILQVTISRNNGKEPILSQMTIRMVIENGVWYVDPNSLKSNEIQETPDPNAKPVITPTPEPYTDGNTVLYYNPDGGKLYHRDANCISVHSKYTPLKGTFTYSQINDGKYAELEPCNVCGAPLRNR